MKQISKLALMAMLIILASCQNDSVEEQAADEQKAVLRFQKDGNVVSDGEEDKDLVFTATSEDMSTRNNSAFVIATKSIDGAAVEQVYTVIDADRAPNTGIQPTSNFWWSETPNASDYNNPDTYYSALDDENLVFTEYADGTASIVGTTVSGTCEVYVNIMLKNKKGWFDWLQEDGGGFKQEGTAGLAANAADMHFYVIDSEHSTITASGDCPQEGTFGVAQRPDPSDPNTPNYGAHVGPGGANYDSNVGALGLSTWGWLTDINTGEYLWLIDFNFRIEPEEPCDDCVGKVDSIKFEWDWHNDYRVRLYQRYENTCYATKIFDEVVGEGDQIYVNGVNQNGTFGKWIYVYVGNCYYTKFRTDCYLNIGPGYKRGVIEVVSGTSTHGGELCEYEPPQHWCWWW